MFIAVIKIIAALGAINWGLVGLFDFNLVDYLFAAFPTAVKMVYLIVGVSGLGIILGLGMDNKSKLT